jgi:hypothetical protein
MTNERANPGRSGNSATPEGKQPAGDGAKAPDQRTEKPKVPPGRTWLVFLVVLLVNDALVEALLERETLDEQEILEVTGLPPAPPLSETRNLSLSEPLQPGAGSKRDW